MSSEPRTSAAADAAAREGRPAAAHGRPSDTATAAEQPGEGRDDFLLGPTTASSDPPSDPAADPLLGVEVGGVVIERVIGVGGMGRVYAGHQLRPPRPVAVKVMRSGPADAALQRRFEFEAEVLGRLRHPGIAAIHAAGTHPLGAHDLPYFVMELIPGARPITRHADAEGLTTRQRLLLFRDVCEAVAHGHRLGVIHRDLKPSNILVDADGRPKVIDFGIACMLGSDATRVTAERDGGHFLGTLQYMSPEQFAPGSVALDVRSDVYSLGVVLYELLASRPPRDPRPTPFQRALAFVRERPEPPLSPAVRGLGGDIAAIVATCLEQDRERRYGSAGELAADIGRHLAGEATMARPPGLAGSVVRLARRHRAAAAATLGILVALIAAVVGISAFAVRAERERTRAVAQSLRADAEADRARRRLYVANLYRIADLARAGSLGAARALFAETAPLVGRGGAATARGPASAALPLELRILAADLDGAIIVLDGGGPLRPLQISHDGRLVAAGGDDGRVRLWTMDEVLRLGPRATPRLLAGHGASVASLAFSPDDTRLATAGRDRVARVWDLSDASATAPSVTCSGHAGEVETVGFSPDGRLVATCSSDGTARLWDAATGAGRLVIRAGSAHILHAVLSPDGTRLAVACDDAVARIHDVATGSEHARMEGHAEPLHGIAWSPDGVLVATASLDGTAGLWDAATGARRHLLEGHTGWVWSVAFSPDGTLVATASEDGTSRTWDVATGTLRTTARHQSAVSGLRFSPDGRRLLARTENLAATVWDVDATTPQFLRGHAEPLTGIAFSPAGTHVATASADGTVRLWDATRPGRLPSLDGPPSRRRLVGFSPDGRLVAAAGTDGSTRLYDAATGVERARFASTPGVPGGLSFTADGRRLAVYLGSDSPRTDVWDVTTGGRIATLAEGHSVPRSPGLLSPDGSRLLTRLPAAGAAHPRSLATAALWDATSGARVALLEGHEGFIAGGAFSPAGGRVATVSYDGTARLWDAATGAAGPVLRGHQGWVMRVNFTPDARALVTSSHDGTVRVWDAATGAAMRVLPVSAGRLLLHTLSPDGTRVATAADDRTTAVWDIATGERIASFTSHAHQIIALEFSPDGTRLATGSTDGTVRLWNPDTGEELTTLRHGPPIAALAFSPDGTCLATAARDEGPIRLWGRSPAEFAAARRVAAPAAAR